MKKPNSNFWKMVGKYIVLPLLLYFSILLFCLVTNHNLWLSRKAFTFFIPGLIIIATVIWMWISHNRVFSRWTVNFYKNFYKEKDIPGRKLGAAHTLTSMLLMLVLGGSMYGVYHFVLEKLMTVQHISRLESQTKVPEDLRVVVDDLTLDSTLLALEYERRNPSSKDVDRYITITTYMYRCVEKRPDMWLMLTDEKKIEENEFQSDSVRGEYLEQLFRKVFSYSPQRAQCYQVDRIEDDSLIVRLKHKYEKKFGEKTFPQGGAVYTLTAVRIDRMNFIFPTGILLISPFALLFFFILYRLSIFEDRINNEDYEKPI